MTIAIVDYGMGNLDSVARATEECGGTPVITSDPSDLDECTHIILPGVGAFNAGMRNIRERGLEDSLRKQTVENQIPLLGICLGMQLLASVGHEGGKTRGLDLIPGNVQRLEPTKEDPRIPHVGWNEVHFEEDSHLFHGIPSGKDFYFVHSYHFVCSDEGNVLATTPYCGEFISAIHRDSITGVQFHPEKSQKPGFQLLRNFLNSGTE